MKPSKSLFQDLILPLKGLDEVLLQRYKSIAQKNQLEQTIKSVLLKNSEDRTYEEIYLIKEYLLGFSYFRKIHNIYGQEALFRISQFSQLVYVAVGTTIVKKTEEPISIHFILEGQVMQITEDKCKVSNIADAIFEENIITNMVNKSDYLVKKNSTFITINGFIFRATIHRYQKRFVEKNHLKFDQAMFQCLGNYDLKDLICSTQVESYIQYQKVFSLNDPVNYLYIILEGELSINQKVGLNKKTDFSNCSNEFVADYVKERAKLNTLAKITINDFFGFEEYLDDFQAREHQVQCESKICKVAKIPLGLFFQKFNQVFNLKEYYQLIQIAKERKQYRKRILSLQIQLFTDHNIALLQQKNKKMFYETIEHIPYENQIRSRPRSFLLKDKILVPDDYEKSNQFSINAKSIKRSENKSIDQNFLTIESSQENAYKLKKKQISINYQIEKKLHKNNSFNKTKFLNKEDFRSLSPMRVEPLSNIRHFKTDQKYDHIQLKKDLQIGGYNQYNVIRDSQNSRCSPLPQIPQFKPRQGKFHQKIIPINKKIQPLLEIV